MTKLPRWCWLVSLVPGVVCVALAVELLNVHFPAERRIRGFGANPLVIAFSVYAGFVVLGYLLLVIARGARPAALRENNEP